LFFSGFFEKLGHRKTPRKVNTNSRLHYKVWTREYQSGRNKAKNWHSREPQREGIIPCSFVRNSYLAKIICSVFLLPYKNTNVGGGATRPLLMDGGLEELHGEYDRLSEISMLCSCKCMTVCTI